MESNLQQQSIKKEDQASPDIQTQNDGQKAGICPNCHAELPEEALFCPECGFSIRQRVCPKCGAPASPTADICQTCGAWLNEDGQCNTGGWRDIVAIAADITFTVGLRADGTAVAVGRNNNGQCNTGSWRDIGPDTEEKRIERERRRRAEQERIEQERLEQ